MALQFVVNNFNKGLITKIEDQSIPEEAASDCLNWLTLGDKIELTGGYTIIGTENAGAGKITSLATPQREDGTQQPFRTYGQKLEYYNLATSDWAENGSDLLGSDADGETVFTTEYTSLAGYQLWLSSPNSSLYKIIIANPADNTDMYDASKNFKGYINVQNGRMHLWYRDQKKNYLYGSHLDSQDSAVYTDVTGEVIDTGDGATVAFSGTLAFKGAGAKRTCFGIVITDTVETFTDDTNGVLTGSAGGTGTINYTTGAWSVTFAVAPPNLQNITADYSWEDSTANGIADFTFSATRVATEGFFLPQATGGDLLNVLPYRTEFYCLHEGNAWLFSMPVDDLSPTNQIFRDKVGMKNARAAVATGEGIYYIDTSNATDPRFKLLTLESGNDQVVPVTVSFNVDLSGYDFDDGVATEYGDYIVFSGKETGETKNNRTFFYNKIWQSFDVTDYGCSVFARYGDKLWSGDSQTNNVQQLFTSFAANDALITNFWEGKLTRLGVDEIKKAKRLTVQGAIGPDQVIKVYLAFDRGGFEEIGEIRGDGAYVDAGVNVEVGSPQVGSAEVGGGGNGIEAFNYVREFRIRTQRFDQVKIKFEATGIGYASISNIDYFDIKRYGQKNIKRYRQTLTT